MRLANRWLCLLLCLASAAVFGSCVTETQERAASGPRSRGSVIEYPPAVVWQQARKTLLQIGQRHRFDENAKSGQAFIGLGEVRVSVEPYDSAGTKSILRISARANGAEAPEVAERVQLHIQQALLQAGH